MHLGTEVNADPNIPIWFESLGVVLAIAIIALAVAALVVLARTKGLSSIQRLVWALAVIFVPVVGPILWLLTRPSIRRSNYPGA